MSKIVHSCIIGTGANMSTAECWDTGSFPVKRRERQLNMRAKKIEILKSVNMVKQKVVKWVQMGFSIYAYGSGSATLFRKEC